MRHGNRSLRSEMPHAMARNATSPSRLINRKSTAVLIVYLGGMDKGGLFTGGWLWLFGLWIGEEFQKRHDTDSSEHDQRKMTGVRA